MVFVRKIKDYYALAHTYRKDGKVLQETKYVGKSLPNKTRLEQLKKEFLAEISGGRNKYLNVDQISEIDSVKEEYEKSVSKLSPIEKNKLKENFMIRFTYDSSKLAGIDITLRQTSLMLKDGIIPKDFNNMKTVKALEGQEKGFLAITSYRGLLNKKFLKKLHKIILAGVDNTISGKFRSDIKRDVEIAGTIYVPPKWRELNKQIDDFFKWYSNENRKLHPLELAALVHVKLISMQPFADGNSRLSRLLMNWILWKRNYPMIDIPVTDLEHYYNVLDLYQMEHKEKPFVEYIYKKYIETNKK